MDQDSRVGRRHLSNFGISLVLRRRTPLGYLLATLMVLINVTIGTALIGQGAAQLLLRVPLPIGAIVGFMLSFASMTLIAAGLAVVILRNISGAATAPMAR